MILEIIQSSSICLQFHFISNACQGRRESGSFDFLVKYKTKFNQLFQLIILEGDNSLEDGHDQRTAFP